MIAGTKPVYSAEKPVIPPAPLPCPTDAVPIAYYFPRSHFLYVSLGSVQEQKCSQPLSPSQL
jgi:hypothetical protein